MASIGDSMTRIYANFKGIDLLNPAPLVDYSRSPDCLNVWKSYDTTEANIIETRPGYEAVQNFENKINGIFLYTGNKLIVHAGTTLYRGSLSGQTRDVLFTGMNDAESQMYMFGDNLYINDGANYLKYDGTTVTRVEDSAYVPTTSIGRAPSGGGTFYEDVNLLTPQRINRFRGDGTSTEYYLDATEIDSVDEVKVNGTVLQQGYTVDTTLGKVTFATAPSTPSYVDYDNVYITFSRTVAGYDERIKNCTIATVFDNRIFFSGNPDFPNGVFHSSLNNPAYCSDLDYYECGNNDNEVKALVVGNNVLWVFKRDDQNKDTIFYMQPNLDTNYGRVYPVSQGNVSIGCYSKGMNFKDNIVFFSRQGLEMMSGSIQYEQSVTHASSMVDSRMINESNYKFLRVCEYKGFMLVAIDNHIYLADSRNVFKGNTGGKEFEWYYWELPVNITAFREVLGTLYFGTDDGDVFVVGGTNDNGQMIEAYWCTPRDFFNYVNHYKKTNKRGSIVRTKNIQNGKIKIATKTNKENDWTLVKEASTNGFDFTTEIEGGSFDFSNFSFDSGDYSYVVFRLKKKKFIDLQLKFYLDDELKSKAIGTDAEEFDVYRTTYYDEDSEETVAILISIKEENGILKVNEEKVNDDGEYRSSTLRGFTDSEGVSGYVIGYTLDLLGNKKYYAVTYGLGTNMVDLAYDEATDTFTEVAGSKRAGSIYWFNQANEHYGVGRRDWKDPSYYNLTNEQVAELLEPAHINLDKPFGIALVEIENFLGGYAKR